MTSKYLLFTPPPSYLERSRLVQFTWTAALNSSQTSPESVLCLRLGGSSCIKMKSRLRAGAWRRVSALCVWFQCCVCWESPAGLWPTTSLLMTPTRTWSWTPTMQTLASERKNPETASGEMFIFVDNERVRGGFMKVQSNLWGFCFCLNYWCHILSTDWNCFLLICLWLMLQ